MSEVTSCGLLMYKIVEDKLYVFLAHPGGPFFFKKDNGCWGIPKGESEAEELHFETAKREFLEETGLTPEGNFIFLDTVKSKRGKTIYCWAFETKIPEMVVKIKSNPFTMVYPANSGIVRSFPEVDRAEFFDLETAKLKIHEAQIPFLDRLYEYLKLTKGIE